MAGSTAVIHMVGHLHHQLKQLRITLAKLHEDCADGDTMLVEITHRVGNDLATLSAIANLQAAATTDPATVGALQSLRNRIHVFASLYRKLSGGIKDLSTAKFLEDICHDLSKAHLGLRPIDIVVNVEPVVLKPHHAVIVGILVNESVTNALKYAFPENLGGTITVGLRHDVALRELVLTVSDNGAGFVEQPSAGMGQRIMRAMSSQLHGTFALERINDLTVATVRFPES
jgi:two-component sensor histidine kinase